jgi:protein O-mannosyl-transferase
MSGLRKNSESKVVFLVALVAAMVFVAFLPSLVNGFVNWDDDLYLTENNVVQNFSLSSFKQVFTSCFAGNYQPLTILSYFLEYKVFKLDPFGYHLTNLILHLINCLLVFQLIYLLSRKLPVALIVMSLFGLHPVHVESVAWVSQRKDVLYALFFLASALSYLYYLQRKKVKPYYYLAIVLFAAALLSKPMAVTLPLVLLLIDYFSFRKLDKSAFYDKIPFFILSLIFAALAVVSQHSSGAIREESFFNLLHKGGIAGYSIIFYLNKVFIPLKLSCFYPYPDLKNSALLYSILAVVVLFVAVIASNRYSRKVIFGSGFFLVTMLPILQFIPIGNTVVADRYVYIASLGIFYILAEWVFWLFTRKTRHLGLWQNLILVTIILIIGFLGCLSWQRCRIWKDSKSLWDDVLNKYPHCAVALSNRGVIYKQEGDIQKALSDYNQAIKINPDYAEPLNNRGVIYKQEGDIQKALSDYNQAIKINPDYADSYYNRGNLYWQQGNLTQALSDYGRVIKINPRYVQAYNNRGVIYYRQGNLIQSVSDCSRAIEINVNYWPAYYNRALAYFAAKEYNLAWADVHKAEGLGVIVDPEFLVALKEATAQDKQGGIIRSKLGR